MGVRRARLPGGGRWRRRRARSKATSGLVPAASKYSADDLISLGFINVPEQAKLVAEPKPLAEVLVQDYDALLPIGGHGPMYTFYQSEAVHTVLRNFHEAGKPVAVICHATRALLETRLSDGSLLVEGIGSPGAVGPVRPQD